MYKKSDLLYTVLHLPTDAAAIFLAFLVSYWLRGSGLEIYRLPLSDYLALAYPATVLWIVVLAIQGLYTKRNLFGTLQNMSTLAVASLAGWAAFVVFLAFLKTEQTLVFPRLMLIYILLFGFLFTFVGRLLLRLLQAILRSFGIGKARLLVMGKGKLAESMESLLLERTNAGLIFVKRIDTTTPEKLMKELKKYRVDELVIADHALSDGQVLEYLAAVQNAGVTCHLVPNMFEVQASNVLFSTLAGTPILTFRQTPLDGWGRIAKRVIDIVLSLIGLTLLSPVFLIIGLLIKITDPGNILYSHTRVGRNGKPFELLKFRSMITKYCTGPGYNPKSEIEIFTELGRHDLIEEFKRDHKVKDDPRISKLGKVMRKTRLDELPQLINVFRGHLSLVGPRPITEKELNRYGRWASYLLSIKPGLTGLWQVSGSNDVSYEERVQIDSHYVQNWSLWKDFVIMIKTVLIVLRGGDGY